MKKLVFIFSCLAILAGCSKDDVPKVVTSVQIDSPSLTVKIGEEHQFSVSHIPADLPSPVYKWESSNTSVATVSDAGLVKAVGVGNATIKATATNGILTTSCSLTVKPIDAEQIVLNKTAAALLIGESTTLTYTIQPANTTYKDVEWSTSNPAVATVENGKIAAVAEGKATIQVKMKNSDVKGTCEVTVNPILATGITLNKGVLNLTVGQKETLTYTITPDNTTNKDVEWSSDNEKFATVSSKGEVTAVAEGTAIISVKVKNTTNVVSTCKVEVSSVKVTGVSLNLSSISIEKGKSQQIIANILPTNATNKKVIWSSSNASIATVVDGTISGLSVGNATITAKTEDGSFVATCQVAVTPIKVTGITLSATTANLLEGETLQLTATAIPSNADDKNITWSSSNSSVATVSSNGLVTGLTVGTVEIVASNSDGSVTSKCNVKIVEITDRISLQFSNGGLAIINGFVTGDMYSYITNNSSKPITLTKFQIIDSYSNQIKVSSTDVSLLGVLGAFQTKNLGAKLNSVYKPIFKWYFIYNNKEYTVQHQY